MTRSLTRTAPWIGLAIGFLLIARPALADDTDQKLKRLMDLQKRIDSAVPGAPSNPGNSFSKRDLGHPAPSPAPAPSGGSNDYHYITTTPPEGAAPGPQKRGSLDAPRLAIQQAAVLLAGEPSAARPADTPRMILVADPAAPGAEPAERLPVAKQNSYVVQLRPEASEAEIKALFAKHHLMVVKDLGLGALLVSVDPSSPTLRSLPSPAPSAAPKSNREALQAILEPQIIRDLRQEPIVGAAFVNTTISPKTLPAPSTTTVKATNGTMFSWTWKAAAANDGNWGLKAIRLPPVWTILGHKRGLHDPKEVRPKVGVIDTGFSQHKHLVFRPALPAPSASSPVNAALPPDCEVGHGTHVAGIIGAVFGTGNGTDGVVPDAEMEAVQIQADFALNASRLSVDQKYQQRTMLIADLIDATNSYLIANYKADTNLRVINISLAYNWVSTGLPPDEDLDKIDGLRLHVAEQAKFVQNTADIFRDRILFVVAAGNDSEKRKVPLDARWASPFAWAGTTPFVTGQASPNILVVEAVDRAGKRAKFSNVNGHVSAPGVDIMSTLAPGTTGYGICSGTSQATPFVSGLAAILFEIDPTLTAPQVADIIKGTAHTTDGQAAPMVDALEAVLAVDPDRISELADFNGDGKVDVQDLQIFKDHYSAIIAARATGAVPKIDLNGDGTVDADECSWPLIDLGGRGGPPTSLSDNHWLGGSLHTDLELIRAGWTDDTVTFSDALKQVGLDQLLVGELTASQPAPSSGPCK